MTTSHSRITYRFAGVLALLAACNGEPYLLEGDDLTGELPDQDVAAVEADRDYPGHPMEDPGEDLFELRAAYCTDEEVEAHRKSNTRADGTVTDEALVCPKRKAAKVETKSAPSAGGSTAR